MTDEAKKVDTRSDFERFFERMYDFVNSNPNKIEIESMMKSITAKMGEKENYLQSLRYFNPQYLTTKEKKGIVHGEIAKLYFLTANLYSKLYTLSGEIVHLEKENESIEEFQSHLAQKAEIIVLDEEEKRYRNECIEASSLIKEKLKEIKIEGEHGVKPT